MTTLSKWIQKRLIIFALPFLPIAFVLAGKPVNVELAVAPRLAQPVPASYFGMHIHMADAGTAWPAAKFGSWRLWDAYAGWPDIEPQRGKWDFQRLDKYVAMARLTSVEILLPLGRTPRWASSRPDEKSGYGPGQAAEPTNLDDWRDYVRTVALRYKGRIQTYEIWNEPNEKGFFSGTPESLLALQREAYHILKEVDPGNVVVMPAVTQSFKWLDNYLALGGGKYADVVGYHFYVPNEAPEALVPAIGEVRSLMRKSGVGDKPLWNTETGWWIANTDGSEEGAGVNSNWKRLGPEQAAAYVARALILGRWAGLGRFYWYAWDNRSLGLIEPGSKQLKPAGRAYATVRNWLVGNTLGGCGHTGPVWSCALADVSGETAWLVWSSNASGTWALPSGWMADSLEDLDAKTRKPVDGSRIPVTESPVRVIGKRR
jgi:hypothetical protein